MKKYAALLALGLLAVALLFFFGRGQEGESRDPFADSGLPRETLTITLPDGDAHHFTVEVARTPGQVRDGLMFRTALEPDAGMLFLLPGVTQTSFWMKNTLIPLDILFIRADGTIAKIHANAQPGDLTPLSSGEPVRAALELNGGRAEALGLVPGGRVDSPSLAPPP